MSHENECKFDSTNQPVNDQNNQVFNSTFGQQPIDFNSFTPQQLQDWWQRMGIMKFPIQRVQQQPQRPINTRTNQQGSPNGQQQQRMFIPQQTQQNMRIQQTQPMIVQPQQYLQQQQIPQIQQIQTQYHQTQHIQQIQPQFQPQIQQTQQVQQIQQVEEEEEMLQIAKNRPRRTPKKVNRDYEPKEKRKVVVQQTESPRPKRTRSIKKKEPAFVCPKLPDEALNSIFSFLQPLPHFISHQRVCKYWNDFLKGQNLWNSVKYLNFSYLKMEKVSQQDIDRVFKDAKNIKQLIFSDTIVDEELAKSISTLNQLEHLTFAFCLFNDIQRLALSIGTVKRLSFCSDQNTPGITLNDLKLLVYGAKNLKELDFEWSKIMEDLNIVPEFKHLRLTGSHESLKSPLKSQFALQLIQVYKKYDLSPNTIFFLDQLQQDLYLDWNFVHSATLLGLDVNIPIDNDKNTLLHLEMKKAEELMKSWNKLRREFLGFQHENPNEVLKKRKEEWELSMNDFSDKIVFLLMHEANITLKNSKKRSCQDIGKEIDNEVATIEFLQEEKRYASDSDEEVHIIVPPCPFKNRHFEYVFNQNFIKVPKKKKFKKRKIEQPEILTEEIIIDPNQFINVNQQ